MAARSKAWVWASSLAVIVGLNPAGGRGCLSVVIVVCCQVEVSASGWSPVQRSPTDCGVSECYHESSKTRGPWSTGGLLHRGNKRHICVRDQGANKAVRRRFYVSVYLTQTSLLVTNCNSVWVHYLYMFRLRSAAIHWEEYRFKHIQIVLSVHFVRRLYNILINVAFIMHNDAQY